MSELGNATSWGEELRRRAEAAEVMDPKSSRARILELEEAYDTMHARAFRLEARVEELEGANARLRVDNAHLANSNADLVKVNLEQGAELTGLREAIREAMKVMKDTRFANPPMDVSECLVLLRRALEGREQ